MSEVIDKLGLSALFGDNSKSEKESTLEFAADKDYRMVSPAKLSPSSFQPRTEFDAGTLQELSESIAKNGIIQPIVVRQKFGGEYEIIAGERRWRASKMLNMQEVPVIVKRLSDKEVFEIAIIENVQRQDLNPLEEAYAYRRLLGEFGYTQDDLARTIGKSRSHVTNLLRLLSLPEQLKTFLNEGRISMGHARALLSASDPVALAERVIDENLSVRQVEDIINGRESKNVESTEQSAVEQMITGIEAITQPEANNATLETSTAPQVEEADTPIASEPKPSKPKSSDVIALEDILKRSLGSEVDIKSSGKKGEIRIKYETLEELDNLLRKLGAAA